MDVLVGTIIAAIATIFGAFLQAFGPDLKKYLWREKSSNSLFGKWRGEWIITFGGDGATGRFSDIDVVEITKITGDEVLGKGVDPANGTYIIKGRDFPFAVTLSYTGYEPDHNHVVGVIILRKTARRDEMQGHWWQYSRNDKIMGGEVKWNRLV